MNAPLHFAACFLMLSGAFLAPVRAAETPLPNLKGLHVALDVGHSRINGGAISARGRSEFRFNWDTARTIAEVLRSAGAKVSIINEKGGFTGLVDRPRVADRLGAHAFISIHHDSVNDKYLKTWEFEGVTRNYCDLYRGYSVFCSKKHVRAADSRGLALELGAALLDVGLKPTLHHHEPIPGENRPFLDERTGVYEYSDLIVAMAGRLPSVLLECGVILHRDEELEVQTKEYQQRLGLAVASALAKAREKKLLEPRPARKKVGWLQKSL